MGKGKNSGSKKRDVEKVKNFFLFYPFIVPLPPCKSNNKTQKILPTFFSVLGKKLSPVSSGYLLIKNNNDN